MGIEKLIPRAAHLGVFLRLLARSGTGPTPLPGYTSHFTASARGEMHVVIVDNGRSRILGQEASAVPSACIRCGACMNTCPRLPASGGIVTATPCRGPSAPSSLRNAIRRSTLAALCIEPLRLLYRCLPVKSTFIISCWRSARCWSTSKAVPMQKRLSMADGLHSVTPVLYRMGGGLCDHHSRLPRTWRTDPGIPGDSNARFHPCPAKLPDLIQKEPFMSSATRFSIRSARLPAGASLPPHNRNQLRRPDQQFEETLP